MILAIVNLLFFGNLLYLYYYSKIHPTYTIYTLIALGFMCIVFSVLTIFDNK